MALFVSYTQLDNTVVHTLINDLERLGRSVWFDHQIYGGKEWWQEIIQQIQDAEVCVFALSNHSWRSKPCRIELSYAEQLHVPVIPVQVGPLESLGITIAKRQIIDYRERSPDAVVDLIAAVTQLGAQPRQLPHPLPEPPEMPFEYIYRLSSLIDVPKISPESQEQLIAQLRQKLKTEEDNGARTHLLMLLNELRRRNDLTVPHAAEIDEILSGVQTKAQASDSPASSDPSSGAAPQAEPGDDRADEGAEDVSKPARWWKFGDGPAPKEQEVAPQWLTDLINTGGGTQTAGATVADTTRLFPQPSGAPPRARKWWIEEQSSPAPPEAPTAAMTTESAASPTSPRMGRRQRIMVVLLIVGLLVAIVAVASQL